MRWVWIALVLACSSKPPPTTTNGSGTGDKPVASGCDGARAKVEALYRAEAEANKEKPERVAEAVADNTHMVMAECAHKPEMPACIARAATAAELETQCLAPLDEEGTEGEALRK